MSFWPIEFEIEVKMSNKSFPNCISERRIVSVWWCATNIHFGWFICLVYLEYFQLFLNNCTQDTNKKERVTFLVENIKVGVIFGHGTLIKADSQKGDRALR